MMIELEKNLRLVQQRIAKAASRAKRDPKEVTLIAVSKTFPTEAIFAAYQLGVRHFGENRVEEASSKIPDVNIRIGSSEHITWHMIGHLQSRKVKDAAELFDYIHSVDSAELAERLNRIGASLNKMIPIMLEVNVSGETRKYGFQQEPRDAFFNSVSKIMTFGSVDVKGLLTLAPMVSNPEEARPFFRSLRVLRDELESRFPNQRFPHLSMGMTDDFETAIEEGATMVRIGRAIFGERVQTSP